MSKPKGNAFYQHSERIHNTVAAEVVVPLILQHLECTSVLDVGCGTGTWLKILLKHGINDIMGIDSPHLDQSQLLISNSQYMGVDLAQPFTLARRFDMLLCLEVAEHLPEAVAERFINDLCSHSDTILFSAAIPGQGGQRHVNEQWPAYWQHKFEKSGYTRLDFIRPFIWGDPRVDVWYRQNMFLYSTKPLLIKKFSGQFIHGEIHPDLWSLKVDALQQLRDEVNNFDRGGAGVARSFKALLNAIKNKM